jgi:hypothetical protein
MPPEDRVSIELEVSPPEAEVMVIGIAPEGEELRKGGYAPRATVPGRYQVNLLRGPDYQVVAKAPGFHPDVLPITVQPGEPPPDKLSIKLSPTDVPPGTGEPVTPANASILRIGLEQVQFEGDPLSPGEMADLRHRIRQAVEAYFLTETSGLELLSDDDLEGYLEAKQAFSENMAQQTDQAVEARLQRLSSGPDVLVSITCIAKSQPDPAAPMQIELSAEVRWTLSGHLAGSKFVDSGLSPEARAALEEILGDPATAEMERKLADREKAIARLRKLMDSVDHVAAGEISDADILSATARRLARQIAYRLHKLYPTRVFPNDLPKEYDAVLLRISEREEDGYPGFLEQEPGDEHQLLGWLDPLTLPELTKGAKVIADGSLNGQTADDRFLEEYGKKLYGWIEPPAGEQLHNAWENAQGNRTGLRLRLCCDSPELQALPWEYLFVPWLDDVPTRHIGLHTDLVFSRYLPPSENQVPIPADGPSPLGGPLCTLVLIPPVCKVQDPHDPSKVTFDLSEVNAKLEAESIQGALDEVGSSHAEEDIRRIEPTILKGDDATWDVALDELRLKSIHPSAFHFIGHGWEDTSDGKVKLVGTERDKNEDLAVSYKCAGDLLKLFGPFAKELRLVLLQSCASGSADPKLLGVGRHLAAFVPVVVAMQHTIGIPRAKRFAHVFYLGLALGHEVDVATAEGRQAIAVGMRDERDWGTPVVYMQRMGLLGGPPILHTAV